MGLTVQLDLLELGLMGEAILTDIKATPKIEGPLDSRDERQVVTATFHHSSGDVIDLVVAARHSCLNLASNALRNVVTYDAGVGKDAGWIHLQVFDPRQQYKLRGDAIDLPRIRAAGLGKEVRA